MGGRFPILDRLGLNLGVMLLFLSPFSRCLAQGSPLDPYKFDFDPKILEAFGPGRTLENIQKEFGKGLLVFKKEPILTYKFYVNRRSYDLTIFVQIGDGKVFNFFAVLPSYFFHDMVHGDLIKLYGKQNEFHHIEKNSIYIWNDVKGNEYIYSATCTLTCFPLYFTGISLEGRKTYGGNRPLLEDLARNSL